MAEFNVNADLYRIGGPPVKVMPTIRWARVGGAVVRRGPDEGECLLEVVRAMCKGVVLEVVMQF